MEEEKRGKEGEGMAEAKEVKERKRRSDLEQEEFEFIKLGTIQLEKVVSGGFKLKFMCSIFN